LEFKTGIPEEKIVAFADGRLLWRVIENLLSNALKYSLENSRVYVDVYESGGWAFLDVKNISKAELNIPEDEITERFKRGDLSRSSEGSGLGLDIASSLMRLQGGELRIKIDGDLFKASVMVPLARDEVVDDGRY
jgi:signal transduction histidine kinase